MACKLVILRNSRGKDMRGDCINAYPIEMYLGDKVEPQGGAYSIIEVMDKNWDDPEIQELLEHYESPQDFNRRRFIIEPPKPNQFLSDLEINGRTQGVFADLQPWISDRGKS